MCAEGATFRSFSESPRQLTLRVNDDTLETIPCAEWDDSVGFAIPQNVFTLDYCFFVPRSFG